MANKAHKLIGRLKMGLLSAPEGLYPSAKTVEEANEKEAKESREKGNELLVKTVQMRLMIFRALPVLSPHRLSVISLSSENTFPKIGRRSTALIERSCTRQAREGEKNVADNSSVKAASGRI